MKTKHYSILFVLFGCLLLFFNNSCKSTYRVSEYSISELIYQAQRNILGDSSISVRSLNSFRKRINWEEKINYSYKKDTIFALEKYNLEGIFYCTYWNKNDTVSFTNCCDNLNFLDEEKSFFPKETMDLVSEWNVFEIMEVDKDPNRRTLTPIYASMIIVKKNKYKVKCLRYRVPPDYLP